MTKLSANAQTDINAALEIMNLMQRAAEKMEAYRDRSGWTGHFEKTYAAQDTVLDAMDDFMKVMMSDIENTKKKFSE